MKSLQRLSRKQDGFTILELIAVTLVIGLLVTLLLVTLSGIKQSTRNNQRQTDIDLVASHLETYNARNTFFPMLADINDAEFVRKELKGLDREATRDPSATSEKADYQFVGGDATETKYGYVPTKDDGSKCNNKVAGDECTKFTLSYQEEGGTLQKVTSL